MTTYLNPLFTLNAKNRVGHEKANELALPTMIYLDAAKRGACPHAGYNALATALLAASGIASQTRSKRFYDIVRNAYDLLVKAGMRPTPLLDLTTAEYQGIRSALAWYVRSLPTVVVGVFSKAQAHAEAMMAH